MNHRPTLIPTASQTVGPFFSIGLCRHNPNNLIPETVSAKQTIKIHGRIFDGDGSPVPDAILEVWSADPLGNFSQPGDRNACNQQGVPAGFARIPVDEKGDFTIEVVKPASIPDAAGATHAPHLVILLFMRGLLKHLVTRVYFPREDLNERDPVLNLVPAERRATLIAEPAGPTATDLRWNIHLQGEAETVFFEA